MKTNHIDIAIIRRDMAVSGLAGFTRSNDGVDVRKAGTPKVSKAE